jgi:uncharacterized phage protein (TIGR01671 family)
MREIKFRVWDLDNKKFHYYDHNAGFDNFKFWDIINDFEHGELQQYTGLKDENKQEIYEGDIINQFKDWWGGIHENGKVCYDNEEAKYVFKSKKHIGGLDYVCPDGGWTVIGNIYQNPELLNTKE